MTFPIVECLYLTLCRSEPIQYTRYPPPLCYGGPVCKCEIFTARGFDKLTTGLRQPETPDVNFLCQSMWFIGMKENYIHKDMTIYGWPCTVFSKHKLHSNRNFLRSWNTFIQTYSFLVHKGIQCVSFLLQIWLAAPWEINLFVTLKFISHYSNFYQCLNCIVLHFSLYSLKMEW